MPCSGRGARAMVSLSNSIMDDKICVHCNIGPQDNDTISHVGARDVRAVDTLFNQATASGLVDTAENIKQQKKSQKSIYIHLSCRTSIRNSTKRSSYSSSAPPKRTRF